MIALDHRRCGAGARAQTDAASQGRVRALRIVVADDAEINRVVMDSWLRRLGCEADLVCDGGELVAAVCRNTYDVALIDLVMPGRDGFWAAEQIRDEVPAESRPYLVALSAFVATPAQSVILAASFDSCLVKPLGPGRLAAELEKLAALRAARVAPRCGPAEVR